MCVLALAWRAHPKWPLIVVGNRDELHARPAAPLARWEEPDHIVAGRDLESGGTWLGVSERGRFAVVTNLRARGGPQAQGTSRGALVASVLSHGQPSADAGLADYNPFNLIFADREQAWFLSNRPEPVRSQLPAGLYGLSNGALDEPWPKTLQLKSRLLEWIVREAEHPETLLDALADETLAESAIAPAIATGAQREPAHSPLFIRHPVYGTRCSTLVAIDEQLRGTIVERRFDEAGRLAGQTNASFVWSG